MADKEVRIDFKTKGDTSGAKKVEKELEKVINTTDRQGKEAVNSGRRTEEALERVENTAEDLRRELDKIDGLDPRVRKQIEGVAESMDRAALNGRKMATAQDKATKSQKNSGLAALEFSRAVEDAQYGIRGVLNNLPSLIQFMGGGPGLAGAISLAAVGLTVLTTALSKTDDKLKGTQKLLEVARDQVDEFYRMSAKDGTAAFRANLESLVETLGFENQALQRNLGLLQKRRQAQLEIARLGGDLELAQIAAGEATGRLSPEQAEEQRRALQIRRIKQEKEEQILKATEQVELLEKQRLAVAEEEEMIRQRIRKREEEFAELLDRRNALQADQEIAEKMAEKGQKQIDKPGILDPITGKSIEGRGLIDRSRIIFSEAERAELIAVEERLAATENAIDTLKEASKTKLLERESLSIAQGEAFNIQQITIETATQAAKLKEEILTTKAAAETTREATKGLSAGVKDLEQAASDVTFQVEGDRRLVESGLSQMRKVMADDQLTTRELQETNQVLGRLAATTIGATKEAIAMINNLQAKVAQLEAGLAGTKSENVRLTQRVNQLGGRR